MIAEKAGVVEEPIEFPSFSCKDAKLPERDEGITIQVYQKVSECAYCLKICDKKPEIDIFIQEYISHDAGRMVSEILDSPAADNEDVYNMALRYYFSHLRAWLVESPNLKKNRTIQNFLIMYERQELLNEVNAVLDLQVKERTGY